MKRKLAAEVLYHSSHYNRTSNARDSDSIPTMGEVAAKRIRQIDPRGDRALALLKEIEKQRQG